MGFIESIPGTPIGKSTQVLIEQKNLAAFLRKIRNLISNLKDTDNGTVNSKNLNGYNLDFFNNAILQFHATSV